MKYQYVKSFELYESELNEGYTKRNEKNVLSLISKYNSDESFGLTELVQQLVSEFGVRASSKKIGEVISYLEDTTDKRYKVNEDPEVVTDIYGILTESLNEGRRNVILKRKYTENYPAVGAGSYAPVREKILSFVVEKGGSVSKEEIKEFISSVNEDGEDININGAWLRQNKKYLKRESKGGETKYSITNLGTRYLKSKAVTEMDAGPMNTPGMGNVTPGETGSGDKFSSMHDEDEEE